MIVTSNIQTYYYRMQRKSQINNKKSKKTHRQLNPANIKNNEVESSETSKLKRKPGFMHLSVAHCEDDANLRCNDQAGKEGNLM